MEQHHLVRLIMVFVIGCGPFAYCQAQTSTSSSEMSISERLRRARAEEDAANQSGSKQAAIESQATSSKEASFSSENFVEVPIDSNPQMKKIADAWTQRAPDGPHKTEKNVDDDSWRNNYPEGPHEEYWPDGVVSKSDIVGGHKQGFEIFYNAKGKIIKKKLYDHGHLIKTDLYDQL